jgi:hypothetical protein
MYITGVDGDERDGWNKPGHYIRIPRVSSGSNVVAGLISPPQLMIPVREPSQASYM